MTHPQLQEILDRITAELRERYGDRLAEIRLFGSQARGDAGEYSDIDLLVVLNDAEVNPVQEQNQLLNFRYDLELEYLTIIQLLFVSQKEFQEKSFHIFEEISREGILL